MRAGGFAEDKCRNHDCKTPADAAQAGAAALLTGFIQVDVHAHAVAQKDQKCCADQFTNKNTHSTHYKPPYKEIMPGRNSPAQVLLFTNSDH